MIGINHSQRERKGATMAQLFHEVSSPLKWFHWGKFCLCLGVSELVPYLGEFILHHGKEDHRDSKWKWISEEMQAWKSDQEIQSTPGYDWPNISFVIEC